jgi:ribulose kinase
MQQSCCCLSAYRADTRVCVRGMCAPAAHRVSDAPALGCAILASVAAGLHPNIVEAVEAMVHVSRVIQPDPQAHQQYQRFYRAYKALVSDPLVLRPLHMRDSMFGCVEAAGVCALVV